MTQESRSNGELYLEMTQMRRNPYLVEYSAGKNTVRHTRQGQENLWVVPEHTRASKSRARAERQRRRRQAKIRRYIRISMLCACILVGIVVLKNLLKLPTDIAEASTPMEAAADTVQQSLKQLEETAGARIQGLPVDVYAVHPSWTEDFLTVNEYSRPGDPLTEVKNIFVHYTANPGTSAAQNRSYFEQLKDITSAVPAPISSLVMTERSFSVFLWMRSPTPCRPATKTPSLSNAVTRQITDSLPRRPTIP